MPLLADEHRTRSETLRKPSATYISSWCNWLSLPRTINDIAKLTYKCLDEEKPTYSLEIYRDCLAYTTSSYSYHTQSSELLFLQLV